MALSVRYEGLRCSRNNLIVHLRVQVQGVVHHGTVSVPLQRLLVGDVTNALDATVRRDLMRLWAMDDEEGTAKLFEL